MPVQSMARVRRALLAVSALVIAGLAPVVADGTAHASDPGYIPAARGGTELPFYIEDENDTGHGRFGELLVDAARQRVYVSAPAKSKLAVLDFDGNLLRTVEGLPGAYGMALDGNALYVALSAGGGIARIDTGTLQRTGTLAAGLGRTRSLVVTGGRLWATQWYCSAAADNPEPSRSQLAAVDLRTGEYTAHTIEHANYCPKIVVNPDDPTMLLAWNPGLTGVLTRIDVSGGVPIARAWTGVPSGNSIGDVAFVPGQGTVLVENSGYGQQFGLDEYRLSDLEIVRVRPMAVYRGRVLATTPARGGLLAVSGDGRYLDIGRFDRSSATDTQAEDKLGLGINDGGMAFSPDGTRLFLVSANDRAPIFTVVDLVGPRLAVNPDSAPLGHQEVGTTGYPASFTVWNVGQGPLHLDGTMAGAHPDDFEAATDCPDEIPGGGKCTIEVAFTPSAAGPRSARLVIDHDAVGAAPVTLALSGVGAEGPNSSGDSGTGYWMLTGAGAVHAFGAARVYGEPAARLGTARAVRLEPTPTGLGYWALDSQGVVHSYGDAVRLGDVDRKVLVDGEAPAGLSATPTGRGYWVVTNRGRVLTFGDAGFFGDMSKVRLNGPILGAVATPTGRGYFMVGADGGIFTFGDAAFHGSTGNLRLNKPVMGMAPAADGRGYWLVASDGGVFAFGVPFHGSMGSTRLNKPIRGMVPGRDGYLMVAEDGGIFAFGDVAFHGSLGARPPASPVVSAALLH
jgi:hypothetical protein